MELQDCNTEHDFALVLTATSALSTDAEDSLFNVGCNDATIGLRNGRIYLTFSRVAPSLKDAILSAIEQVRSAKIGADVLRVDYCNLVTLSDIARKIGRSRQCVHQYAIGTRGPGAFPPPVCEICDGSLLWYWCEVAAWLYDNSMIKENVLRDAEHVELINNVLEFHRQKHAKPTLTEEVERLCSACE